MNPTPTERDTGAQCTVAILFAEWEPGACDAPLAIPNIMLPLLGRSMLQLALERLVRDGCSSIHVVLGDTPGPLRDFLGDGTRWGCRVVCHQPMASEGLQAILRRVGVAVGQDYIVATASRLPLSDAAAGLSEAARALVTHTAAGERWTGWGRFPGHWLLSYDIDADFAAFESALLKDACTPRLAVAPPLGAASPTQILDSAARLLASSADGPRRSRGCDLHPGAHIIEPVFIGHHVKIAAGATVGPNAVLGDGVFIDQGAGVRNSAVLPNTYVGEALDLDHVIAGPRHIANTRLETLVEVRDSHLLSPLPRSAFAPVGTRRGEMRIAQALHIALAPLRPLAHTLGRRKADDGGWRHPYLAHFAHEFYPGLSEVACGGLYLLGPRRRRDGAAPADETWRELHPNAGFGLLNEAVLNDPCGMAGEGDVASDAMACALQGQVAMSARFVGHYLRRLIRDIFPWRPGARANAALPATGATPPLTRDSTGA